MWGLGMLTYDQKSEIRIAFDEAYVPSDRRRDSRVNLRTDAEICAWKHNQQGQPFTVRIQDFSPGGVGLLHTAEMKVGNEYLLRVPRPEMDELVVLLTVARCKPMEDGNFWIGMELSSVMDRDSMGKLVDVLREPKRVTSRWTMILFILLGIAAIGTSLLV
jgi:hypothetical protein